MINRTIAIYESLFSDPITIQIRFRYATTDPDGSPLSHGLVSESDTTLYTNIPWNTYISALRADARTSNDNIANTSLPGNALSPNIRSTSGNGRAVGLNTPPAMFANGTVGQGGPYDGIVGIADALGNPRLELHNGTGALIATNDDWQTTILGGIITSNQVSDIQNSGHAPTAASESAIIANLQPGNYTAIVSGVNNSTGVALVEVYDLSPGASSSLGNLSTRSFVETGEHVMIGGFIVQGTGSKRVIIRAIGPELTQYGITNAMGNPRLELHDGTGALIATNDDWQTTILGGIITSNQVSDIQNSGHAPTMASESAIIADLQAGNYTAIVRGVNNTVGIALVEVYDLN